MPARRRRWSVTRIAARLCSPKQRSLSPRRPISQPPPGRSRPCSGTDPGEGGDHGARRMHLSFFRKLETSELPGHTGQRWYRAKSLGGTSVAGELGEPRLEDRLLFCFLASLPPEGPHCHFTKDRHDLGPISAQIRGVTYFYFLSTGGGVCLAPRRQSAGRNHNATLC